MDYISIAEAAEKWGVTRRRVEELCNEGRIPGLTRFGKAWAIPKDAEIPAYARITTPVTEGDRYYSSLMEKRQKEREGTVVSNLVTSPKLKRRLIVGIVIAVVFVIAISVVFFVGYKNAKEKYIEEIQDLKVEVERLSDPIAAYEEVSREVDIHLINSDIQNIGELATVEYLYTDAGKYEDPAELFGKPILLSITTKSFIAKWDGSIKAGVDISRVTAEEKESVKEIVIHIPKAEILSHEIDSESIETLDQKDGLFNSVKIEDVRDFDAASKAAMEQRAIENGILDKAVENAKTIIGGLVNTGVVKDLGYSIVFEIIE